ncbi:AzlC family ABC transporter permease [Demequina sp. NBRC 110057]|uniref:AzlC family ABC transporter permease n=1 Tax=Demequina sp. NBRC 110057 TaxID=1570346 RepID=UPI000A0173EE|nr:AzlC family ABC transporter permease [Demequina sp. NBRC 110057]
MPARPRRIGPQQRRDFRAGARAIAPLMPGSVVFGLAVGALINLAGWPAWMGPYASATVSAGASQIAIIDALTQGAPAVIAILTALVINARLALYSASLAPVFAAFPTRWKLVLSYLMTDQSAAVSVLTQDAWPNPVRRRWFILGVSGPFTGVWILGTAAGAILGPVIPAEWQIGFIVPLMFIAVLVPALRTLPAVAATGISIAVVLLLKDLPYGLNVLAGAIAGIGLASFIPDRADAGGASGGGSPEAVAE